MAGFPMMGAGTAQSEQDRKRHAWLDEDADIWGQPADLVPSVVESDWLTGTAHGGRVHG